MDHCTICKKVIEKGEFAWFLIGTSGYEPESECVCIKCQNKLLRLSEENRI